MVEKYIEDNCAGDIRDGFDSEKSLEIIKIASLDYLSIKQLNVNGLRPEDPSTWNTRNGNPAYNNQISVTNKMVGHYNKKIMFLLLMMDGQMKEISREINIDKLREIK